MTNALDRVPARWQDLLIEILSRKDPELLRTLRTQPHLSREEAESGMRTLQWEFMSHVGPDSEPTSRGKEIDELVGAFIGCFIMD